MANLPHRRCAVYTRKSSEEGLEQEFNSLGAQREACEAFIRRHLFAGSDYPGGIPWAQTFRYAGGIDQPMHDGGWFRRSGGGWSDLRRHRRLRTRVPVVRAVAGPGRACDLVRFSGARSGNRYAVGAEGAWFPLNGSTPQMATTALKRDGDLTPMGEAGIGFVGWGRRPSLSMGAQRGPAVRISFAPPTRRLSLKFSENRLKSRPVRVHLYRSCHRRRRRCTPNGPDP
jgi:hypothetical protein